MNNFFPSGNVRSPPLARFEPSLARNPWTVTSVPGGTEFLFQPRRSSAFGAPPSIIHATTFPSEPFTSMWSHGWGLIHSILVTVPFNVTGLDPSNTDVNA